MSGSPGGVWSCMSGCCCCWPSSMLLPGCCCCCSRFSCSKRSWISSGCSLIQTEKNGLRIKDEPFNWHLKTSESGKYIRMQNKANKYLYNILVPDDTGTVPLTFTNSIYPDTGSQGSKIVIPKENNLTIKRRFLYLKKNMTRHRHDRETLI